MLGVVAWDELGLCVNPIQMSPPPPFTNVTRRRLAVGGRGAPGVAQRPTGARLTGLATAPVLVLGRQYARLVEQLSRLQIDEGCADRDGAAGDHCDVHPWRSCSFEDQTMEYSAAQQPRAGPDTTAVFCRCSLPKSG
jgi:hypothetical protein